MDVAVDRLFFTWKLQLMSIWLLDDTDDTIPGIPSVPFEMVPSSGSSRFSTRSCRALVWGGSRSHGAGPPLTTVGRYGGGR